MDKTNIDPVIEELFKANVHLGHRKNRIHPKAKKYIYKMVNGTGIIDLTYTANQFTEAKKYLKQLSKEGKKLLVVATKKIIGGFVADYGDKNDIFYITSKWPPGLLTNFDTIMKNVKKLNKLEDDKKNGAWDKFVKHEVVKLEKEIFKLKKIYKGIAKLEKKPDVLLIVDIKNEKNALKEAKNNNIPVIAISDTNSNPETVDFPIVANDDSAISLQYLLKELLDAYIVKNNFMIDYSKLKLLREQTGVSFALCKKALEETNNDIEKAKKKLVELAGAKIMEKQTRPTAAGAIFTYVHHNKKIAAFIEVMCETDFVSSNSDFQKLGGELAMQLASLPAKDKDELLNQEYIRDAGKKINDLIKEAVLKFGENIKIGKFERWVLGN